MIKTALLILISTYLSVSSGFAEDWTTTDGKKYKDIKVMKSDGITVTILDSEGGAAIPLATLPPDLQKRFNYSGASTDHQGAGEIDLSPLTERPEWSQRLHELSLNLENLKKQGGQFFTSKGQSYLWHNITNVTPMKLSYSTNHGTGTVFVSDLSDDAIEQLGLKSDEIAKWSAEQTHIDQAQQQLEKSRQDKWVATQKHDQKVVQDAINEKAQKWNLAMQKHFDDTNGAAPLMDAVNAANLKAQQLDVHIAQLQQKAGYSGADQAAYKAAIILLQPQADEANQQAAAAARALSDYNKEHSGSN